MTFNKIDDLRHVPQAQSDFQKVSFVLHELGVQVNPEILSKKTIDLILDSVSEGVTGSYGFSGENRVDLLVSIRQDELQNELTSATSHTHARDIMAQMGI